MFENLKNKKFLITGGTGFLGKNLIQYLNSLGTVVHGFGSEFNLYYEDNAEKILTIHNTKYDYIIHGAVLQGAGEWPLHHKAEQFDVNCKIHTNILKAWKTHQPQARLIGLGSSCSYPGIKTELFEREYWDGRMHDSVDIYGLTKKVMNTGIEAYKAQHGLKGTTVIFATLYGPHDSFDREKSHVVSALIRKFVEAKESKSDEVEVWGDGTQTRELIFVEDQIKGLLLVLDYEGELINIGTGNSITIKELAENIKDIIGYQGNIFYNVNRFVGIKHKVLNIDLAKKLYGWTTKIPLGSLNENLRKTIDWYYSNKENLK